MTHSMPRRALLAEIGADLIVVLTLVALIIIQGARASNTSADPVRTPESGSRQSEPLLL